KTPGKGVGTSHSAFMGSSRRFQCWASLPWPRLFVMGKGYDAYRDRGWHVKTNWKQDWKEEKYNSYSRNKGWGGEDRGPKGKGGGKDSSNLSKWLTWVLRHGATE
ncbi:unnamed protein product, partial [Effrenium voratum]